MKYGVLDGDRFVLDLRHRMQVPDMFARMTWQRLFDIYREVGADIDDLHDLLVDLDILKSKISRAMKEYRGTQICLGYWRVSESGSTDFLTEKEFNEEQYVTANTYKLTYWNSRIEVEKVHEVVQRSR